GEGYDMYRKLHYRHLMIILLLIIFSGEIPYGVDIFPEIEFRKEIILDMESADNLNIDFALSNDGIELKELYLQGNIFGGQLSLGRRYQRSGPGYFSQLLLSDQSTPLNMIMHEGKFTVADFENNYTMLLAYLDEGVNKQLF